MGLMPLLCKNPAPPPPNSPPSSHASSYSPSLSPCLPPLLSGDNEEGPCCGHGYEPLPHPSTSHLLLRPVGACLPACLPACLGDGVTACGDAVPNERCTAVAMTAMTNGVWRVARAAALLGLSVGGARARMDEGSELRLSNPLYQYHCAAPFLQPVAPVTIHDHELR